MSVDKGETPDWENLKTEILEQYSSHGDSGCYMPFDYNQLYAAMDDYYVQKTELLASLLKPIESITDSEIEKMAEEYASKDFENKSRWEYHALYLAFIAGCKAILNKQQ